MTERERDLVRDPALGKHGGFSFWQVTPARHATRRLNGERRP
jgi:hypothetical protein